MENDRNDRIEAKEEREAYRKNKEAEEKNAKEKEENKGKGWFNNLGNFWGGK